MATPFNEEIYNHLSTILERSVGISLDMRQIDRLRLESDRLAEVITKHVERISQEKALQVCKLLNEATKAGFQSVAAELEVLKGNKEADLEDQARADQRTLEASEE